MLRFKGQPGTQQMYQENLKYKTQREVRRRPRFVSAHDVKTERYLIFCYRHRFYIVPCYSDTAVLEISFPQVTSPLRGLTVCLLCSAPSQSSSSSTAESVPPHWDKNALPDFGYKVYLQHILFCFIFYNVFVPLQRLNIYRQVTN